MSERISERRDEATTGGRERGSALVIVLIVLLALSAIGLVAVRSVGQTIQRSGTYRVRATAGDFSDAAARYVIKRKASNAMNLLSPMSAAERDDMGGQSKSRRRQIAQQGGYTLNVQESSDVNDDGTTDRQFEDLTGASDKETGLFTDGSNPSFESLNADSRFRVIVRNAGGSMPAPGYSEEYCFKLVTIAAESRLGTFDPDWKSTAQVGAGRTAVEALVGPIGQCG